MQGDLDHLFSPDEQRRVKEIALKLSGAGLGDYHEAMRTIVTLASAHRWQVAFFYANWREEGIKVANLIARLSKYANRKTF
jgi:hypothetical protein